MCVRLLTNVDLLFEQGKQSRDTERDAAVKPQINKHKTAIHSLAKYVNHYGHEIFEELRPDTFPSSAM